MAGRVSLLLAAAVFAWAAQDARGPIDLAGKSRDPFASAVRARVFLFVRTDCPITNRYAPELRRIAAGFAGRGVEFWLIYPDASETARGIAEHIAAYQLPGEPLRDPHHLLVKRSQATVSPEAAVFDAANRLLYLGRIDDRFVEFGKSRPSPQTHDLERSIAAVLEGRPVLQARTRAIGCFLADVE